MADLGESTNPKYLYGIAAIAGGLLSLRILVESSAWVRVTSVFSAACTGYYLGPPFARKLLQVPATDVDTIAGVTMVVAFVGVNLLAGFGEFGRRWARDPAAAFAWAVSIWKGGPVVPPPAPPAAQQATDKASPSAPSAGGREGGA